jgi:hypothetical protein
MNTLRKGSDNAIEINEMLVINTLSTATETPPPKVKEHAAADKFMNKYAKSPDIGFSGRRITNYLLRGPEADWRMRHLRWIALEECCAQG